MGNNFLYVVVVQQDRLICCQSQERIKPLRNILDNEGKKVPAEHLSLKMQTLADENGYWMDTGIFLIQLFD